MYIDLHVKYQLILSDFNKTRNLSTYFRKIFKFKFFLKICPVGAELFPVDGRTDMTKLKVIFRNFVNALKRRSESRNPLTA